MRLVILHVINFYVSPFIQKNSFIRRSFFRSFTITWMPHGTHVFYSFSFVKKLQKVEFPPGNEFVSRVLGAGSISRERNKEGLLRRKKTNQKRKEHPSSPYIRGGLRRGYFEEEK